MTKVSIILEKAGGTTNCYDGNIWDNSFCPDPATCNANCEMGNHLTIILFADNWYNFDSLFFLHRHINLLEGCESADWAGTYGVTASGSGNTKSLSSFVFCHHYFCPHMYFVIIICCVFIPSCHWNCHHSWIPTRLSSPSSWYSHVSFLSPDNLFFKTYHFVCLLIFLFIFNHFFVCL